MPRRSAKSKVSQAEAKRLVEKAREHTDVAIDALADTAKNGKGSPKVSAALALLHYGWGKPPQLEGVGSPVEEWTDEDVKNEMKRINQGKSKLPEK